MEGTVVDRVVLPGAHTGTNALDLGQVPDTTVSLRTEPLWYGMVRRSEEGGGVKEGDQCTENSRWSNSLTTERPLTCNLFGNENIPEILIVMLS